VKIDLHLSEMFTKVQQKHDEVAAILLHGSQNYGLSDETSDVDGRAIVLCSREELIFRKPPVSYILQNGDDGQCDVKDALEIAHNLLKMNPNFLEILFTDYSVINPNYSTMMDILTNHANDIAQASMTRLLQAILGQQRAKMVEAFKIRPSSEKSINQFGYCGKNILHFFRLSEMARKIMGGVSFKNSLQTDKRQELLVYKRGEIPVNEVIPQTKQEMGEITRQVELFLQGVDKEKENKRIDEVRVFLLDWVLGVYL
jgi:predicted nucleotidyltransferase